jgi:hypothetical protein
MSGIWGASGRLRAAPDDAVLRIAVVAIAVVQAVVLGLLARRGSWQSDDLDFLVQGGKGFAPGDLLSPVNDHIAPGLRFVYAVFAHVAPLNYDVTVAWRVLMQAIAIVLFGFLLLRLLGPNWWAVAGTALYALTPVSMPSFMSLASAVNNLPAHVFGILALHAVVDWYAGRRRRAVAYGPLSLLISLACWEKSVVILFTVLALALYLRKTSLHQWVRQSWPLGAAFAVPLVAFGILYASHGRPSEGNWPGLGQLLKLAWRAFAVPVGALAGGPWRWSEAAVPYGLADAPAVAVVIGSVVLVVLLFVAWRSDRRVLLFWGSVVLYVLTTWLLLSYGRFEVFGAVFVLHYHYWSDMAIPLILAVVLTVRSVRLGARLSRLVPVAVACCMIAWTGAVVVSDAGFAQLWGRNPSRAYFDNLTADLENAGPSVNLWDISMPSTVSTILSEDRRLSPVLRTAGIPFRLQGPGDPQIVSATGHLEPATFVSWAKTNTPGNCARKLQGTAPVTQPLQVLVAHDPTRWFAKLAYSSQQEVRVLVELVAADGQVAAMPLPADPWPSSHLANMYFGTSEPIRPVAVRLRTLDPAATVCLGEFELGLPKGTG